MTRSHRFASRFLALGCLLLAGALPALAAHHESEEGAAAHAAGEHDDAVQVVSTNVQGKNVFIPSTIVIEAGAPAALSVFNTTDTPHGFQIEAATRLQVGDKVTVLIPSNHAELPGLEADAEVLRVQATDSGKQLLGLSVLEMR